MNLSVLSINLFQGGTLDKSFSVLDHFRNKQVFSFYNRDENGLTLVDKINQLNPDVLLFQEALSEKPNEYLQEFIKNIPSFKLLYVENGSHKTCKRECLQTWINRKSRFKVSNLQEYNPSTELCNTKNRTTQLITLSGPTGEIVKIGNVHLCGGRYDDRDVQNQSLENIANIKQLHLKYLVENGANCIVGDFNADLLTGLKGVAPTPSTLEYINQLGINQEQFTAWNQDAFQYLLDQGFQEIFDELDIDLIPTSIQGNRTDSIWYTNPPLVALDAQTVNFIDAYQTDHNGVFALFGVKEKKIEEKGPLQENPRELRRERLRRHQIMTKEEQSQEYIRLSRQELDIFKSDFEEDEGKHDEPLSSSRCPRKRCFTPFHFTVLGRSGALGRPNTVTGRSPVSS